VEGASPADAGAREDAHRRVFAPPVDHLAFYEPSAGTRTDIPGLVDGVMGRRDDVGPAEMTDAPPRAFPVNALRLLVRRLYSSRASVSVRIACVGQTPAQSRTLAVVMSAHTSRPSPGCSPRGSRHNRWRTGCTWSALGAGRWYLQSPVLRVAASFSGLAQGEAYLPTY